MIVGSHPAISGVAECADSAVGCRLLLSVVSANFHRVPLFLLLVDARFSVPKQFPVAGGPLPTSTRTSTCIPHWFVWVSKSLSGADLHPILFERRQILFRHAFQPVRRFPTPTGCLSDSPISRICENCNFGVPTNRLGLSRARWITSRSSTVSHCRRSYCSRPHVRPPVLTCCLSASLLIFGVFCLTASHLHLEVSLLPILIFD